MSAHSTRSFPLMEIIIETRASSHSSLCEDYAESDESSRNGSLVSDESSSSHTTSEDGWSMSSQRSNGRGSISSEWLITESVTDRRGYTTIRRTAVRYRPASGSVRLVSLHKSTPTRSVPFESEEIPGAAQSSVFSARTCTSVSTSPSDTSISSNENATESSVTDQDAYSNLTVSPGPQAITSFIRNPVPKRPSAYSVINPHYQSAATADAIPYANAAWCLSQQDRMPNSHSQSRYTRARLRRTPLRSRRRATNRYTIASSWCKSITSPKQLWDTARTRYRRWKLPSRCDREKAGVSSAASRTRRRTGRYLQSGTSRWETTVPSHRETHTQEKLSKHLQRKSLR